MGSLQSYLRGWCDWILQHPGSIMLSRRVTVTAAQNAVLLPSVVVVSLCQVLFPICGEYKFEVADILWRKHE